MTAPAAYRVLHVTHRYWPFAGGSEQYVAAVAERQGGSTVYTTDAWDLAHLWAPRQRRVERPDEMRHGVRIRRFPVRHPAFSSWLFRGRRWLAGAMPAAAWPVARRLSQGAPEVPALTRALRSEPSTFDLVHGWNVTLDGLLWPALDAARRARVPFVLTPFTHLSDNSGDRRRYTAPHQLHLLRTADRVIVMTPLEAEALAGLGVEPGRMVVAGPGLTPGNLLGGDGAAFRSRYAVAGPLVAFIGALERDKGAYDAVRAAGQLAMAGKQVTLALAGPNNGRDFNAYLRGQPPAVQAACRYVGYLSDTEKRDLLAAADLLVLPSRTESFGIVYLEAWLYGKPVIGARAGGVAEVIDDGVDGYLVPFGDIAALAARIACLVDDPQAAAAMGAAGQAKTLRQHTWERTFRIIEQVYDELCGKNKLREPDSPCEATCMKGRI